MQHNKIYSSIHVVSIFILISHIYLRRVLIYKLTSIVCICKTIFNIEIQRKVFQATMLPKICMANTWNVLTKSLLVWVLWNYVLQMVDTSNFDAMILVLMCNRSFIACKIHVHRSLLNQFNVFSVYIYKLGLYKPLQTNTSNLKIV